MLVVVGHGMFLVLLSTCLPVWCRSPTVTWEFVLCWLPKELLWVRVDLSEMACSDTEVELKSVWEYLMTMMLVLSVVWQSTMRKSYM